MKIGVLTQPPTVNYGGILQAFALQKALLSKGYEVVLLDKRFHTSRYSYFKQKIKYILFNILNRDISGIIRSKKEADILSLNTKEFIEKYILKTDPILTEVQLANYNSLDAYIVGSDQVWRPMYTDNIYNYYLDFIADNRSVRRVAYAASFGTSNWEYSEKETEKCKRLLSKFDAVSCREISGVDLCQRKYNISAEHVLDPTLLLSKDDYLNNIDFNGFDVPKSNVFSYVLDSTDAKSNLIRKISCKLNTSIYNLALSTRDTAGNVIPTPSIEYWINGIANSQFVVTDSFHGTVFAIMFNKPFIAIINSERGASRFESLLAMLDIEGNLVKDVSQIDIVSLLSKAQNINWEKVNKRIETLRLESFSFLDKALRK